MANKGLEAVTATSQGTWVSMNNTKAFSVHVFGSTATGFNATVTLRGSNRATKPSSSFDDVLLGTATAETLIVVASPIKWFKAMVPSYTAGTISTGFAGGYEGA